MGLNESYVLRVLSISKRFRKRVVVSNVSFSVKRGEIYALVGPNGAGKTTTLRIIAGIYSSDSGRVEICGMLPSRARANRCLAFLPEDVSVYDRLTGFEHIKLIASLYASSREEIEILVEKAVRYSALKTSDLNRRAGEYSKGMKRRLLLASLLALEPPLLILDEPSAGLDVHSAVMVRNLIKNLAARGRAVLVTSHNMFEVEKLADRVGFIYNGKLVDEDSPQALLAKHGARDLEEAFVNAVKRFEERD